MKQLTFNKKQKLDSTVNKEINNKLHYHINTNEIPGELSCENLIFSLVKITCYLHT